MRKMRSDEMIGDGAVNSPLSRKSLKKVSGRTVVFRYRRSDPLHTQVSRQSDPLFKQRLPQASPLLVCAHPDLPDKRAILFAWGAVTDDCTDEIAVFLCKQTGVAEIGRK